MENSTSEKNGTKSEEETKEERKNLSERVASFFRLSRKESSSQCQDNVELGLNGSKCSANGTSNPTKDDTDAAEEKTNDEKPDTEEETSNETPIRFSKFLNLFKRSSQKTMEKLEEIENVKEQSVNEEEQEQDKPQEETPESKEQVEFEPETKPAENIGTTNEIELEEGENSPKMASSPKNTAV